MEWQLRHQRDLSTQELYDVLALRAAVFVVEQDCSYLDPDGQDLVDDVHHLLGFDDGQLVAAARLLPPEHPVPGHRPDATETRHVHLGRIVVAGTHRGTGLGRELVARSVAAGEQLWPGVPQEMAAQAHLADFYGRFGFASVSGVYDWDGIDHVDLVRTTGA
ncbi:GNAT family N-acetyltransferase [Nocardioides limicola]|uniref:GNAT family N-acetyltransferase n=1 Tax=Nocardioides limicola TaxID=2803368 RepID=UPI00193C590A|nr:GNAT family N-acetyltransferase [Nocardioides sp. DJM-14]